MFGILAGGHTEVVSLLLHYGAKTEAKTKNGMTPMDLAGCGSKCWHLIYTAEYGILPELPSQADVVPVIPWYALTAQTSTDATSLAITDKKKEQSDGQKQKKTRK